MANTMNPRSVFLQLLSLILLCCFISNASARESQTINPKLYFGTYQFEDGVRITGGRFDEAGKQMLLYMDTAHQARGALLEKHNNEFVPAFGSSNPERVTFEEDGDVLLWQMPSGKIMRAERILQPRIQAVSFKSGEFALEGSLYLPPELEPPFPAVVLAHGSGPANRYAGPWVMFFIERGFAVLFYDKRGTGGSQGNWKTASYPDLAEDLSTGVEWLSKQPQINVEHLGIHTSSQSGWYGPHVAADNAKVSFLIQRAAPAVNIALGTAHEMREEWRLQGVSEVDIAHAITFWLMLHEAARQKAPLATAQKLFEKAKAQPWFESTFGNWQSIKPGWWQRHVANMQLEPAKAAAKTSIPILWFLADRDQNVPFLESFNALKVAKEKNSAITIQTVSNSQHSFLIQTGERMQYTDQYWQVINDWLEKVGKPLTPGKR